MKLILNGVASNMHGSKQGIYSLGEKLVNSYPFWEQQNGNNALWFVKTYRLWMVGPKIHLGQTNGGIIGPRSIDRSPTNIINWWRYADYNGIRNDATASEILFKDLSPSMPYFKSVNPYKDQNVLTLQWLLTLMK